MSKRGKGLDEGVWGEVSEGMEVGKGGEVGVEKMAMSGEKWRGWRVRDE